MASAWRGNVPIEEVRPRDVVLEGIRDRTEARHAALVEEVRRQPGGPIQAVGVSEWNWGRSIDERGIVSETFSRLAPGRWIDPRVIRQVWRPDLPTRE